MSNKDKKRLCDKIASLSKTEHDEIFKILQESAYSYTQNSNGVFINFSSISDEDFLKIDAFVKFCFDNKESLDEYDKKLNECKNMHAIQKLSNSIPLTNIINIQNENNATLQSIIDEAKYNTKVETFVALLENRGESLFVNKTNTKFINAKKKFSKKMLAEKKNDVHLQPNLDFEKPLMEKTDLRALTFLEG